ncbi:uncharacterized protein LOC120110622 [Phoenix dactylifera]|uniref:Uncharacterized protein LOC120110622 n=1 Tax=Phoenix dactylifera TaxID=42345 RepID=A0A8B9AFT2_PHODC|nr:uncharacterized protein LOC120110622 [Phoenix dactylifera]
MDAEVVAVPLANDHLVLRFKTTTDRDRAMSNGPWVVAGQLLAMEPWSPDLVTGHDAVKTAVVWLCLPRLPVEYWNSATILEIEAEAGRPIAIDSLTEQRKVMGFARVRVAIDVIAPLLPDVQLHGTRRPLWQPFVYGGLPGVCFRCWRIGHAGESCTFLQPEKVALRGDLGTSPGAASRQLAFGPWPTAS